MIRTVAIVDDDINITSALKRTVRPRKGVWSLQMFNSAEDVLDYMIQKPVNILFSDIRMPGQDGFFLLKKVAELHPETVRVIFSGHYEEEKVLDSVRYAHQYVAKPARSEEIVRIIERLCYLQGLVNNSQLEQMIGGLTSLQTLPDIYVSLLKALKEPDPTLNQIAHIIGEDMALTTRVMQLVNSAFFGVPHRVTDLQQAVTLLGIGHIRDLVLSVPFFSLWEQGHISRHTVDRLWRHSADVSAVARRICEIEGRDADMAATASLAGMLHDVGKLVLLNSPLYREEIVRHKPVTTEEELDLELRMFGCTHAETGGYLLGIWGIEDAVVEAVLNHHQPERGVINQEITATTLVHAATHIVRCLEGKDSADAGSLNTAYLEYIGCKKRYQQWLESVSKGR